MRGVAATAHSTYINAVPYPHIVLGDFFDPKSIAQADGGGLHQIVRGSKLGIHANFNRHGA